MNLISVIEHDLPYGVMMDITSTLISVNVYRREENGEITTGPLCQYSLEELKAYEEWRANSFWLLPINMLNLTTRTFINRSALTLSSRMGSSRFFGMLGLFAPITMVVPFSGCTFDDCSFIISCSAVAPLVTDVPLSTLSKDEILAHTFPGLAIDGPTEVDSNAVIPYTLRVTNPDTIPALDFPITLSAHGGYLPLTQIYVSSETTTFNLHTTGLVAGQRFELRAGYRFWDAVVSKALVVK